MICPGCGTYVAGAQTETCCGKMKRPQRLLVYCSRETAKTISHHTPSSLMPKNKPEASQSRNQPIRLKGETHPCCINNRVSKQQKQKAKKKRNCHRIVASQHDVLIHPSCRDGQGAEVCGVRTAWSSFLASCGQGGGDGGATFPIQRLWPRLEYRLVRYLPHDVVLHPIALLLSSPYPLCMLRRILSTTAVATPRYRLITIIPTTVIVVVWQDNLSQNQERLGFGDHLPLQLVIADHQRWLSLLGDKTKQESDELWLIPITRSMISDS